MRSWRLSQILWAALAILVLGAGVVMCSGVERVEEPLDPSSTGPMGTKALRELLGVYAQSVRVDVIDTNTDVVVMLDADWFGGGEDYLRTLAERGGHVIILGPGNQLAPPDMVGPRVEEIVGGDCAVASLADLGGLRARAWPLSAEGFDRFCFGTQTAAGVVQRSVGEGWITVVGSPLHFTNANLLAGDHAAVIVRLVTQTEDPRVSLIWALQFPGEADGVDTAQPTLWDFVPTRIVMALLQLVVATLAWLLYRGHRFGKVPAETPMVEIPASLLVHSAAELHRRAGSHAWAVACLRTDFAQRLRRQYRLPPSSTPDQIAAAVSVQSEVDHPLTAKILGAVYPATNQGLAQMVADIDTIAPLVFDTAPAVGAGAPPNPTRSSADD